MTGDWTDEQNDAIVADYFAMLAADVVGRAYSKAEHNRRLQSLIGRPHGSIEYKHQNISAVLKGLGEDWIPGYKPAFNFQASLVDAVVRWLQRHPDWLAPAARIAMGPPPAALREESMLWIGPPPTHSNAPPPDELEQMTAIARKYDVAERDARNRALGRAGEERVLAHERASLVAAGRTDLAERIRRMTLNNAMSNTPWSPARQSQGRVQTWVTSQWKLLASPGQFSAAINIICLL